MAYTEDEKSTGLDTLDSSTLANGDLGIVGDVSDSGRAKAITWTNIKAFLKTYFDTLFATAPASSTDNAIARFDGTTGKTIQNSGILVSDLSGNSYTIFPPEIAGAGYTIILHGGNSSGATGGTTRIIGGDSNGGGGNGGNVDIIPGAKNGAGSIGNITLYSDTTASFGAKFDLTAIASSTKTFTFPNQTGTFMIQVAVPANAGAAGVAGTFAYESGFLYICVATNTWQRVAIATW